jgi:hypothetical protein
MGTQALAGVAPASDFGGGAAWARVPFPWIAPAFFLLGFCECVSTELVSWCEEHSSALIFDYLWKRFSDCV